MIPRPDSWILTALLFLLGLAYQLFFVGWVLLRPRRLQSSSLAWIVIILTLPVLGGVLFLLFGRVWIPGNRERRHQEIVRRLRGRGYQGWSGTAAVELSTAGRGLAGLAEQGGEMPVRPGNAVDLYWETEEVIRGLVEDIDAARRYCHLLFYIYLPDGSGKAVAEALHRAAGRGVECRLLVDSLGSRDFLRSPMASELRQAGVRVVEALPTAFKLFQRGRVDMRNHRKIGVIDGVVGWTGSQNIADAAFAPKAKYAPWVDCMIRIRGPLVWDLHELFIEDWYMDSMESLEGYLDRIPEPVADGIPAQLMPSGVNAANDALVQVIQAGIHLAREEVILTTPYFVPDEGTFAALVTAAARGVRTRLVVPRRNDSPLVAAASKSFYEPFMAAGGEIYEFTRGLLHSKTITVDREGCLLGTANLDRRSFEINFELSVLIFDSDFASQLRALQLSYINESIRVKLDAFRNRPVTHRLAENACGLLSPVL